MGRPWIRRLIVALAVGLAGGLLGSAAVLIAVWVAHFGPEWIQAYGSVAAVIVSMVAVWLVKGTLDATRDAVVATKTIGDAQIDAANATLEETKRYGDAQMRPWIAVTKFEVERRPHLFKDIDGLRLYHKGSLYLKNYGNTPARNITIKSEFKFFVAEREGDEMLINNYEMERFTKKRSIPDIYPNQELEILDYELPSIQSVRQLIFWGGNIQYHRQYSAQTITENFLIVIRRLQNEDFTCNIEASMSIVNDAGS